MSRTELRTELMSCLAPLMDNEKAMEKVLVYVHAITTEDEAPCRFSHDEMLERLQNAEADIALNKGQSIEEVMMEASQW